MNDYDRKSFSQSGEDMIINFIFSARGIDKPSYMDIGANDPIKLSNTAFFYQKGSRGINVEPNPSLYKKLVKYRENDINLNMGIGIQDGELDFFVMNVSTMSTFSKESADVLCSKFNFYIDNIIPVKVETMNNISDQYFNGRYPDFISLDTEGLDMEILSGMDFDREGAYVICVETLEYSERFDGRKNTEILDFLSSKRYMIYADTYINTIFVKKDWLMG